MARKYKYEKWFSIEGHRYVARADSLEKLYEKVAAKKQEIQEGGRLLSPRMTLSDWTDICLKTYKAHISPDTLRSFRSAIKASVLDYIGSMRLQSIRPLHCQQCLNRLSGKSRQHIQRVSWLLSFVLQKAVENNLIRNNPAENLSSPQGYVTHRRALTKAERAVFEEVVLSDRRYYIFALMLFCGCRPAEAAKCMGYDLQIKDGVPILHIRGTKTANADRFVPIPDKLWSVIHDTPMTEPIGINLSGGQVTTTNHVHRSWTRLTKAVNIAMGCKVGKYKVLIPPLPLSPDLVPYNLRHEFCTELARNQVDIRVAQKLMGHASVKMTANIYTNLDQEDIIDIARSLPGVAVGVADGSGKTEKKEG